MKKQLIFLALTVLFAPNFLKAQFSYDDIRFWVGSGTDTSVLVISFNDGTWDSSYAWGYLHNGADGEDMLQAVAQADKNLSAIISGGFLNDMTYHRHEGIGGTNGFYWSTWDGNHPDSMSSNMGLSTPVGNGDWFGCSFTDFNPAVHPGAPIAAFHPGVLTAGDIDFWAGSGTDTAFLVIDFKDAQDTSAFAWGYLFNDSVAGEKVLQDIAAADTALTVNFSVGAIHKIEYGNFSGTAGSTENWITWSATNYGDWDLSNGPDAMIKDGMIYGISFTAHNNPERPGYPKGASLPTGMEPMGSPAPLTIFPNPAVNSVSIAADFSGERPIKIYSLSGKLLFVGKGNDKTQVDISSLPPGVYLVEVDGQRRKLVKQ